jgi:hypothetical protein
MKQSSLIHVESIEKAIYLIRGERVMLDRDLAALYGLATKALKQAVRRNLDRFPNDLMFVLDTNEFRSWRSQFVTSKADQKGTSLCADGLHRTWNSYVVECLKQRPGDPGQH